MHAATGPGGPYWPPSPQPTIPSLVVTRTRRELRSGNLACDERKLLDPSGTRRMNVSTLLIRTSNTLVDAHGRSLVEDRRYPVVGVFQMRPHGRGGPFAIARA